MKQGNTNKSKKRSNKSRGSRQNRNTSRNEVVYTLPRNRHIVPDSLTTNLTYIDQTNNFVRNVITNIGSVRYRPSGVFDVDPNIFTTAVPGYKELTSLYGKYRLLSSKIRVTFSNLEAVPVHVYIWPSNFDLGTNYGFAAASIASPFARSHSLSRAGGIDTITLTRGVQTSQIFGTNEVIYDDDFAAGSTTTPVNNWFWNVGAWGPSLTTLVNGVQTLTVIDLTVQFTERIAITN